MNMFPDSFNNFLKSGCPHCNCEYHLDDIDSIGIGTSADRHNAPRDVVPELQIRLTCINRGKLTVMSGPRKIQEIVQLIECQYLRLEHYELRGLEEDFENDEPFPEGVDGAPVLDEPAIDLFEHDEVMPSRRKGMSLSAISDYEVRVFLNLLHRTSFKRSSKSFNEFMRKMKVDL